MNSVALIGRLTRDPEVRQTGETKVARYTLAVDRRIKKEGQPSADFISCVAFGRAADFVEMYLHQGTKIAVTGRIQTGSYTKQDGTRVYTTDVIVNEHEFVEPKAHDGLKEAPKEAPQQMTMSDDNGFMDLPDGLDEELPFH